MARGNPNPKIDQIVEYQFKRVGDEPLSKKPLQFRIPQSQYEKLMKLSSSERLNLLRKWVSEGLESLPTG